MTKNKELRIDYIPEFLTELKQLLSSGVIISEAISIMQECSSNRQDEDICNTLSNIYNSLEDGNTLGISLKNTKKFPSYMCELISIAEESGKLEDTLDKLKEYYKRQIRLTTKIKSAIIYPTLLLLAMIGIVVIIITQVLPVFNSAFNQLGAQLGTFAIAMMKLGETISNLATVLIIIGIVLGILGIALYLSTKLRNKLFNIILVKFGNYKVIKKIYVTKFIYSLGLLISTGEPIDSAINKSKTVCVDNKQLEDKISKAYTSIIDGDSISSALYENNILESKDVSLLRIGEKTGNTGNILDEIAKNREEESIKSINKLVNTVEPTIISIVGIIAAITVISTILPLLAIISSL